MPARFSSRNGLLYVVAIVWLAGAVLLIGTGRNESEVEVAHWVNGHLIDSPDLLPQFAKAFNQNRVETASGKKIQIKLIKANSGQIIGELISRVTRGIAIDRAKPNPIIVTPAAEHWVNDVNRTTGKSVLDRSNVETIATTYIGIVTSREMAQCLGWPQQEIGFADIVALTTDPAGWTRYACARPEWGREPLLAFTWPSRSSTARSVLYALYAIAAGKAPEALTLSDIARPDVAEQMKRFQSTIDCYVPDTLDLNLRILYGPSCAQFYFLAEDNLVQMYQGKVEAPGNAAKNLQRDLVMIYPKEGSIVHNHSAFIVNGSFVSKEQAEAARLWVGFLKEENQQETLMQAGFRPARPGTCVNPLGSPFSQCVVTPHTLINPERIDPEVAAGILKAWD